MPRTTIVAEIGQNHSGSIETALLMVRAAKACGVDAVKFQARTNAIAVPDHMKDQRKSTPWGEMSYLEYRERLELSNEDYLKIDHECEHLGIPWSVSVWDIPALERMRPFSLPWVKIPSACLTDLDLIRAAKATGTPVVISTGMSTAAQVDAALALLTLGDVVCHCNSTYPCPVEDLNLQCIPILRTLAPYGVQTGYSGHEVGLATTVAAVALGATYVERHFTLDRSMWGSDQSASVEPAGMARLVKDIRNVERAMGDGVKRVTAGEMDAMKRLRRVP